MPQITAPAVKVEQDNRVLYLTRFTVAELTSPGFYRVEKLVAGEDVGYQRVLDKRRAHRFASHIQEAEGRAFLPTSLFLATKEDLDYNSAKGAISFETSGDKSQPFFYMVDGQHRASGLEEVASRLDGQWLLEFPVFAVVAAGLNDAEQMVQFLVVNTTQKKVSTDIEQQILAQFTRERGVEDMPDLPQWIRSQIEDSADLRALNLIKHLNESGASPWCGKIQMANEDKTEHTTAKQNMLVSSLKRHVLIRGHPVALQSDESKRARMLENYWKAIAVCCLGPNPGAGVMDGPLFKSIGVDIFHEASMGVFRHLVRNGSFRESDFRKCLNAAGDLISSDEFAEMLHRPDFWRRGGLASGFNKAMCRKYANALSEAIGQIDIENDELNIQV